MNPLDCWTDSPQFQPEKEVKLKLKLIGPTLDIERKDKFKESPFLFVQGTTHQVGSARS